MNKNIKPLKLEKKLKNYSALALGVTALANTTNAQVLYTDEHPDKMFGDTSSYFLNLNAGMYADFSIQQGMATSVNVVMLNAFTYNEVLGANSSSYFMPLALDKGDSISENEVYWNSNQEHPMTMNYQGPVGAYGYWQGVQDKYLGLRIKINNDYQYGWARLDVSEDAKTFLIKDMLIETTPNKGVTAGTALDGMVFQEIVATDDKDNGDGSDIKISFKKAANENLLTEYRVIAVKLMKSFEFTPADAFSMGNGKYTVISKAGTTTDIYLPTDAKDSDGDLIANKNFYRFFILSVPASNKVEDAVLSTSSKSVVNVNVWAPKVSNVEVSDVSDYGDGRDLQVSFKKADDESGIERYKVFVVPSEHAEAFDLYAAQNLGPLLETKVEKTGSDLTTVLSENAKDVTGNPVATDKEYVVFVLSASDGTNTTEDNLSEPSAPITLTGTSGIFEENFNLELNYFNNQLFFKSEKPEVLDLNIYQSNGKLVLSDKIDSNSSYSLERLPSGFYIVKISGNSTQKSIKIIKN